MFINIIHSIGFKSRALRANLSAQNERTGRVLPLNCGHHLARYGIFRSRDLVVVTDTKGAGVVRLCRLSA